MTPPSPPRISRRRLLRGPLVLRELQPPLLEPQTRVGPGRAAPGHVLVEELREEPVLTVQLREVRPLVALQAAIEQPHVGSARTQREGTQPSGEAAVRRGDPFVAGRRRDAHLERVRAGRGRQARKAQGQGGEPVTS